MAEADSHATTIKGTDEMLAGERRAGEVSGTVSLDAGKEQFSSMVTVISTSCANPLCPNKSREPRLQECARCKSVRYCSKSCQTQDWKVHKKTCNKLDPKDTHWEVRNVWSLGYDFWILLRAAVPIVKVFNELYVRKTTFAKEPDGALILDYKKRPSEMVRDAEFIRSTGIPRPSGFVEGDRMPARIYQMHKTEEADAWMEELVERAEVVNYDDIMQDPKLYPLREWTEAARAQRLADPEGLTAFPLGIACLGDLIITGLVWIQCYDFDSWI